jgi:hypothetical protein
VHPVQLLYLAFLRLGSCRLFRFQVLQPAIQFFLPNMLIFGFAWHGCIPFCVALCARPIHNDWPIPHYQDGIQPAERVGRGFTGPWVRHPHAAAARFLGRRQGWPAAWVSLRPLSGAAQWSRTRKVHSWNSACSFVVGREPGSGSLGNSALGAFDDYRHLDTLRRGRRVEQPVKARLA